MANGRVDIRVMKRTGKARLRFYDVYPGHLEMVLAALEMAREDSGTHSDTVALDAICTHFLVSYQPEKCEDPKKPEGN